MRPTVITSVSKVAGQTVTAANDVLAAEEPLEIRLSYTTPDGKATRNISVTMRTPGGDKDLAVGFLFTEGIVHGKDDIAAVEMIAENVVVVALSAGIAPALNSLERNFYTTSSCGVCGKASIDAINTACPLPDAYPYDELKLPADILFGLPDALRSSQSVFEQTGGIHACALFDTEGKLLQMREDVGRHNALDKLIGHCLMNGMMPLPRYVLLLSGRASFELVQKAAMAGINIVVAIGAPSSLAAQIAEDRNMTLIGFLRGEKFNIYSGAQRILI